MYKHTISNAGTYVQTHNLKYRNLCTNTHNLEYIMVAVMYYLQLWLTHTV